MSESKKTEEKWIKKWSDSKIFEAVPEHGKKKFFGTFPYPYVNSYLHLGHFYSSMRLEALSRYKRMQGYNVLYAQGWHCTGSPIVSTAKRIKENEPKQVEILRKQGFSDAEIKKFADPVEWIKFFPKEAKKDFTEMGYSIDFRREFITTDLNPHYDKFIRWQFNKLKEKGFVKKGKFPVVWDPKENTPVGDHDRIEGEGETPQEYTLVKHEFDGKFVVTATLRPDTIMGVTNLYVNPESTLVEAQVNDEVWIISEKVANDLVFQDKKVKIEKTISGHSLIGKKVKEFSGGEILILPATFVSAEIGTGIVHSVPSDSADDLIALFDLQRNEAECKKFSLDFKEVCAIKPIAVLEIPGYSEIPASDVIKSLGIKNQHEKDKLAKAKELLYKEGFYKGKLNSLYKKKQKRLSKDYSGKPVEEVKELIKEDIISSGFGDRYYQLTGKVIARSLAVCVVKIVDDQWFMAYGDEKWKKLAHKCLDQMKLYPEKTRSQFNYVLDWLRDWACTREFGLGTRLPWDEKWLIESLSDSTIYMAYYTISYKLKEIDPAKLDDNLFDYIYLGKGNAKKLLIEKRIADELKAEFEYWYPMDFRNTGKDLIQNHMSFCIFNHTAVFPEKYWPKSFGLNGHVMVDGDKMSKSKGNFVIMRDALAEFGADPSRFTVLSGGESIDDANFDRELVKSMTPKINSLLEFAKQYYNTGRNSRLAIDEWMEGKINSIIIETTKCYEETMFRSALQSCYFEMQNAVKWYMKRTLNNSNKSVINWLIETQALLLAPIVPFICEEIWEAIGKKEFISTAKWPQVKLMTAEMDKSEDIVKTTLDDINSVLSLLKLESPKRIKLFIAEEWKYSLNVLLKEEMKKTREFPALMGIVMKDETYKKYSKEVTGIIQKTLKSPGKELVDHDREFAALKESAEFFAKEFGAVVNVLKAEGCTEQKAKQAMPNKPAILVE
jgi:leucyl-tRNA synthetase